MYHRASDELLIVMGSPKVLMGLSGYSDNEAWENRKKYSEILDTCSAGE